jgi:hypothetical protein
MFARIFDTVWRVRIIGQLSAIQVNIKIIDDELLFPCREPIQRMLCNPIMSSILWIVWVSAPSAIAPALNTEDERKDQSNMDSQKN